ncbi:ABC transporter permease [Phycicoccus flavus]|uniref:ABC transporter permease n=1 Tax=Phycicoccus flavus TaxID=2502783 RepID=UPI000FEB62F4|nr:ABC transporter permease [Phycicoccus flavus]NHA68572.1 ABC transporter permease [Phycicoccus flavus]
MSSTTTTPDRTGAPGPATADGGSARSAWALVARREIVVRLTDKAFLGGTAFTLVLICGYLGWQVWDSSRTDSYTVAVTAADRSMGDRLVQGAPESGQDVEVALDPVADADAARAAVRAGDADAWLHPGEGGWVLTTLDSEEDTLAGVTREVVRSTVLEQQATRLGTTATALEQGTTVTPQLLEGDAEQAQIARAGSFVFAFLFYIATLTFGYVIANSVVEEKQSRIVEIIATAIPVRQLLAGKVVGTSVIAILQMLLYAAVGLVGLSFTPYSDVLGAVSGPVAWFLAFFVGGFVALAALWAVAGALASRAEDVQSTGTPLIMIVLGVFFAGFLVDGPARVVLSFVPPFSTVVMPARVLEGTATWWQAVLALVLLLAAAGLVLYVAERLYRRSLLQTGGRLSIRQAWSTPE